MCPPVWNNHCGTQEKLSEHLSDSGHCNVWRCFGRQSQGRANHAFRGRFSTNQEASRVNAHRGFRRRPVRNSENPTIDFQKNTSICTSEGPLWETMRKTRRRWSSSIASWSGRRTALSTRPTNSMLWEYVRGTARAKRLGGIRERQRR